MFKKISLFFLVIFISVNGFSQIGSIPKFNHLKRKNITVQVFDSPCPHFIDTKEKYGFSIICSEKLTKKAIRKQKRAIRIINKTFGINWFQINYNSLKQ